MATGLQTGLKPPVPVPPPSIPAHLLQWLKDRSPRQRWAMSAALAALLGLWLGIGCYQSSTAPQSLYAFALSTDDLQDITVHLDRRGDAYQVVGDRIMVAPGTRASLVKWLADTYALPHPQAPHSPTSSFLPPPPPDPKSIEEHELARLIRTFSFVRDCQVMLVLPDDNGLESKDPSQAAIQIDVKPGMTPAAEQIDGLVGDVTAAVSGLTAEHVRVVDQDGIDLYRKRPTQDDPQSLEQALTAKVRTELDTEFGPSNYALAINVERNETSSESKRHEVLQGAPSRQDEHTEIYHNTASTQAGSEYHQHRQQTTFDVGTFDKVQHIPAGAIRRITATVTVNRALSATQIASVTRAVEDSIGADVSRDDRVTVRSAAFWVPLPITDPGPHAASKTAAVPLVLLALLLSGVAVGAAGLAWCLRRPALREHAAPTATCIEADIVDLSKDRRGHGTGTAPRQQLEALAARHPQRVAKLLATWLEQEA